MKRLLKKIIGTDNNKAFRNQWLTHALARVLAGFRILNGGVGDFGNKPLCANLAYPMTDVRFIYLVSRKNSMSSHDAACFGYHCIAIKQEGC